MTERAKHIAAHSFLLQLFWGVPEGQAKAAAEFYSFAAKNGLLNTPVPRP